MESEAHTEGLPQRLESKIKIKKQIHLCQTSDLEEEGAKGAMFSHPFETFHERLALGRTEH